MPTHVLKVDTDHAQMRLDVFLTENLPEACSRHFVQKLIEAGQVKVNGKQQKNRHKVHPGDEIEVEVALAVEEDIQPEDIPLEIFHEDEDILVINKPEGMVVHPAQSFRSGTLVNALLFHCKKLSDFNSSTRPGIVHRLDRETSGLMVVAKTNKAHANLAKQFERHRVKKHYVALVEGSVEFEEGEIDAALARHSRFFEKRAVSFSEEAKKAKTRYRVMKRFKKATLVALYPKTGRTHQLRVHMAYLGHPILGDTKYGRAATFPRLALHAQGLGFFHPRTGEYVEFSSPLPAVFQGTLQE